MTSWLPTTLARSLLALPRGETTRVSLNLGLSTVLVRRLQDGVEAVGVTITEETLTRAAVFRDVIVEIGPSGIAVPLQLALGGRLYKLICTATAPTLMIAGIQMHRRDDAWADAEAKARSVVRGGDWVLDTCGGLGYTARCALAAGAGLVLSAEPNRAVRRLRQHNPWSPPAPTTGLLLRGTSAEVLVERLPDGGIDSVIHDPPRFSLAGSLYGRSFYASLRRVLRRGGRLYHYTGSPYSKRRGQSFVQNTAKRLAACGFTVSWDPVTVGLIGRAR
ncbi:hypothetical protein JXA88_16365 [Candidatus Fermentibacteria bacterium]|nr:hypothetical protein [Candidatus Fermentibacteria bacterium]